VPEKAHFGFLWREAWWIDIPPRIPILAFAMGCERGTAWFPSPIVALPLSVPLTRQLAVGYIAVKVRGAG